MPDIAVNGTVLRYESRGSGVPVVLTPGGRWAGHVHGMVANALAKECRVITWDRRNTDGGSGIAASGDLSEADVAADDLAALIRGLDLGPCYAGEYAGCRTTPTLAYKYPELVRGMLLAWPSGEEYAAERLPRNAYRPFMRAALRGGMRAVCELNPFAASIAIRPANRDALMALDPREFARQMAYWDGFFTTSGDLPVAGCRLNDEQWASINVPASVTGGCDPVHPTAVAQRIARLLPLSEYHEPVCTLEEWDREFGPTIPYPETSKFQGALIAPVWLDFIRRQEAKESA